MSRIGAAFLSLAVLAGPSLGAAGTPPRASAPRTKVVTPAPPLPGAAVLRPWTKVTARQAAASSAPAPLVTMPDGTELGAVTCMAGYCPAAGPEVPGVSGAVRPTRRDLVLALIARMPFERISSAAIAVAEAPLQVDYVPGGAGRERGWGRVTVGLRWRLDPTGPVRPGEQ